MEVQSLRISKVFSGGGDIHYVLPRFQREYAWEKSNWQTLLTDIFSIYENYEVENEPEHFMGALVVISDGNRHGTIPAFKLVDGQQRLTTISLALCALGNLIKDTHQSIYKKIRKMLENEDESGEIRYKILPTKKYGDRDSYISVIESNFHENLSQSRIYEAYQFFYDQISKRLEDGLNPETLFLVFSNCLQVVFINLDKRERPYEIFESLNAKGKPLTQPDLVRNYIAMMLSEKNQEEAFLHWETIENKLRESETVSRIGELTAFLRHYLAFRNGILPNKEHVYARFRDRIEKNLKSDDTNFANEIETLARFADYYDRFLRPENEPDDKIRQKLERLKIAESATAYPFLLGIFEDHNQARISHSDLLTALDIIENYLMRRFLANEQTNYTNKMFPSLLREVVHSKVAETLKTALLKRNYPSDEQIHNILPRIALYTSASKSRLIFAMMEINKQLSEDTDGFTILKDSATIEHIMPQTPSEIWKKHIGSNWEDTYRDYLNTIGNLTVVTKNWNSSMSNSPWEEKYTRLSNHALLINKVYFENNPEKWDDDSILERAEWLSNHAIKVWKSLGDPPSTISYSGQSPVSITILGEQTNVSSWREIAVTVMEFVIKMTDNFQNFAHTFDSGYISIEEKPNMKQLSNGWWLYVKLSANSIMSLCAKAMEQLELTDEDWEVQVK